MAEPTNVPVLEYRQDEPRPSRKRRRLLYCVGIPLLAFGLAGGFRNDEAAIVAAIGGFLVALALPVGEWV